MSLDRKEDAIEAHRRGIKLAKKHLELNPDDVRALCLGASSLVETGEREQGLSWARRAVKIAPEEPGLLYNVACLYSTAGEAEESLDYLERAIKLGYAHKSWLENDSDFDPLRETPRFQTLLKNLS